MNGNKSTLAWVIESLWRFPKKRIGKRIRTICDDLPHKKRVTIVSAMLTFFVLVAFCVFGHACYKIGARQAVKTIEIQHIGNLSLPELAPNSNIKFPAYEDARVENED